MHTPLVFEFVCVCVLEGRVQLLSCSQAGEGQVCPRCRSDACVDACEPGSAHVLMCLGLEKETE